MDEGAAQLIGREGEVRLVEAFIADAGRGTHVLLLQGEAGIGKTTIWHAALDAAAGRGYRVVVTRPTEAEARWELHRKLQNGTLEPLRQAEREWERQRQEQSPSY